MEGSSMNKTILTILLVSMNIACFAFSNEKLASDIFLKRHSGKSYDPSRTVSKEQIYVLIEAARWTPSSHNDQPWNFIICERSLTPESYQKVFNSLKPETQQKWAVNAPLLIVVVARSVESHKNKTNPWNQYDTGAAAISMALQAADLDLMAHQIGGFNKELIQREFQLPENHHPMTVMVVGYELEEPNPPIRERKPIGANFFLGEWGVGFQ
jgi:nitroreductase